MQIYGDPQFTSSLDPVLAAIHNTIGQPDRADLDTRRAALIQAGQLEQAIADCPEATTRSLLPSAEALSDALAAAWLDRGCADPIDSGLRHLQGELSRVRRDHAITFKVPEGFEIYALFPEQYRDAARLWSAHGGAQSGEFVVVVGVRSIGTTPSAVVAGRLAGAGLPIQDRQFRFHRLAYAALHYSLMRFSAGLAHTVEDERRRQQDAAERYLGHVRKALRETT